MRREGLIGLVVLAKIARRFAVRRLHVAEQRFFDAYNRGGQLAHRELVVPLDYFARPQVEEALLAWLVGGEPLGLETLAEAWMADGRRGNLATFHANLAQFLAILHEDEAYAVTWRGPDGELLSYGSEVFD